MDIRDEDQQPSQLLAPRTMPNSDPCLMELMVSPPAFASPIISLLTPSPAAGTRRSRCREMDGGLCRGPWCRTVVMWHKSFGADEQDPRRWAKQPRSVRRYAMH